MKKFDIQRFAKRRIQVGDNLQGKTIYIDNFPAGYAKEAATFDSWDRFILMDGNDDMMALNYFAIGQLKDENGVSILDNQFGVLTYIGMPGAVDQYIYRGTYDGNTVTNESQLSEMTICSTWISQGSSVVKTIHDNISAYRYFYIEDSHVRPLKVGDEITTDTKFYFNIPDNIELSLMGASTDNYNVVSLDGDNGFTINCINNDSQALIRFSSSMGSTEDGTIYEKMNGALNINKSLMENVTTMDSNWVGTVKELKIDTPVYKLILVDETTLGNYIGSYEKRFIQIGDNLNDEIIYCDLNDIPWHSFKDNNTGNFITTDSNSILLSTPSNNETRTATIEYKIGTNTSEVLLKSTYDNHGAINSAVKQLSSDFGIVSEIDTNNIGYPLVSIKNPNIRQIQVGDKITNNTKFYFKFPNNINKYISTNISLFSYIFTVQGEGSGYKAGLWVFNEDGLATTGEQKISLVGEGWSPIKKDIYKYESNKNVTNETEYTFIENFGKINEIDNELSKYVLVDITTLEQEAPVPTTSIGTVSYKNNGNWNKLLSLAQEQVPLRGSIMPGPIKWSAVNSTAECIDSKTLYFVFGEEEASPTYETLTAQAKGATYGDSIFGGSGSHILVVKNSDDKQNEYPYTVSLNGSGFYTDLEFSVVTNKPFQLGITFSYGLDPSMSSNQVSLGATLLDLISYESFSFNTVVTGTEGVGQTYWFPTTNSSGTQLTFDWLKNANLRITSSVSEYGQACLSGDTKIKTLNNDIYISDLELGDKVIDKDNQETEITKIYNHKINTVYQIHLDNDETIECSYDHKFLVDGGRATTAAQLKENDKLGQHIITSIDIINKELDVYEIKTENNTYTLANGIICECENI